MTDHRATPVAQESMGMALDFIEAHRTELIQLCGQLVSAKSVNPPGRTVEAAAVLRRFLSMQGISSEILGNKPEKPNLVSQCHGWSGGRHLVFNGHIDTLSPGEESEWSVPIYEMSKCNGRLYGLGMGNMKGATAALSLAYAFLARHRNLWRGTVSFTAVADETVFGPDGAAWLLEARPDLLGDALICGEGPGAMGLSIAEKGVLWIAMEARAPAGQGMLSRRGSSAIARLSSAIAQIDAMNEETAVPPDEVSCLMEQAGEHALRLSVNVGTISGGRFVSQVATRAMAEIDFRLPPGLTTGQIESRLAKLIKQMPEVTLRRIKGWEPNWTTPDAPIVRCVSRAAEVVRGRQPRPVVRLPASDASRWRAQGVPAVCFGPQPTLASGVDDFANENDVVDCAKIYVLAALAYFEGADIGSPRPAA